MAYILIGILAFITSVVCLIWLDEYYNAGINNNVLMAVSLFAGTCWPLAIILIPVLLIIAVLLFLFNCSDEYLDKLRTLMKGK